MSDDNLIRIRLSLKGRPIKSYSFNQDLITVGRDPGADICLDNPGISREHLRLERLPHGQYSVRDSGSANGTFLNNERVATAMLYNTDLLQVGKYMLRIQVEHDPRGVVQSEAARRGPSDPALETMMLSPEDLERMMSATRQKDDAFKGTVERGAVAGPSRANRTRAGRLVMIGVVIIFAASVGAGFAWLFLR